MQIRQKYKKPAFTLLELIIVIMIMVLVYTLSTAKLNVITKKKKETTLTLKNLKNFLKSFKFKDSVRVVCYDNLKKCFIILDDNQTKKIAPDFIKDYLKSYRYDTMLGLEEINNEIYFDKNSIERNIDFSYTLYKNGIGEQIIVQTKEKVYDFSEYSKDVTVYNSLKELKSAKDKLISEVAQ